MFSRTFCWAQRLSEAWPRAQNLDAECYSTGPKQDRMRIAASPTPFHRRHRNRASRAKKEGRNLSIPPSQHSPAASYSPVTPSVTVPSALKGLTAVFGMGTGVSPSPWRPETFRARPWASAQAPTKLNSRVCKCSRSNLVCDSTFAVPSG